MTSVQQHLMTADEFFQWANQADHQDRLFELERGVPVEMPPPGELHGVICSFIAHLLWAYVIQQKQGYVCSNDTGLLVEENPDTLRGPDVMLFTEKTQAEELRKKYAVRVPKLVVEVVSPTDQISKTNQRIGQYLTRGVALVWLVDPESRIVTVYRPGQHHQVLDETDELNDESVLPAFTCKVAELFTLPDETK